MDYQNIRNFKDFLLQYNKISEDCFLHCVNDLSCRELNEDELSCSEKCAYKHVKLNNRAMQVYVEVQPAMTQKRIEEMNKQAEIQVSAVDDKSKSDSLTSPENVNQL